VKASAPFGANRSCRFLKAVLAIHLVPAPARALDPISSEPSVPAVSAPPATEGERIVWIRQRLDRRSHSARLWWGGWIGIQGALLAGQLAYARESERLHPEWDARTARDHRMPLVVGAVMAGLGVITTVAAPPRAMLGSRGLDDAGLPAAEQALRRAALDARSPRRPLAQGLTVAANVVAGILLSVVWDLPRDGLIQAGVGSLVGEIQNWTAPQGAWKDARAYTERFGTRIMP
jgi:hypothetical protein